MLHVLSVVYHAIAHLTVVTEKYPPAHRWHKAEGI